MQREKSRMLKVLRIQVSVLEWAVCSGSGGSPMKNSVYPPAGIVKWPSLNSKYKVCPKRAHQTECIETCSQRCRTKDAFLGCMCTETSSHTRTPPDAPPDGPSDAPTPPHTAARKCTKNSTRIVSTTPKAELGGAHKWARRYYMGKSNLSLAALCADKPRSHGECGGASSDGSACGRGQETQVLHRSDGPFARAGAHWRGWWAAS